MTMLIQINKTYFETRMITKLAENDEKCKLLETRKRSQLTIHIFC